MPSVSIKRIPLSQVIVGIIFLLGILLNFAARQEAARVERDLTALKAQLAQSLGQAVSLEQALKDVQEGIHSWEVKFPPGEEDVIRTVTAAAKEQRIDLLAIHSLPRTVFGGPDNLPVTIDGKTCHHLVMSLDLKGSYRQLVNYLEALEQKIAAVFTIEQMQINKIVAEPGRLNVKLVVKVYLLI